MADQLIILPLQHNAIRDVFEYGYDLEHLFDEQPTVDANGDLTTSLAATTQAQTLLIYNTTVRGYCRDDQFYEITLDLQKSCIIKKFYWFDLVGSPTFKVESSSDGLTYTLIADHVQDLWNTWRQYDIPVEKQTFRYLKISISINYTFPEGFAIWGDGVDGIQPDFTEPPIQELHILPIIDTFFGTNTFINEPVANEAVTTKNRQYFNATWIVNNDAVGIDDVPNRVDVAWDVFEYMFAPSWSFPDLDTDFLNRRNAGLQTILDVKSTLYALKSAWNTGSYSNTAKPLDDGTTDGTNPNNYKTYANAIFNIAARYGSATVADAFLNLKTGQPRLSGLNYIDGIEVWNEQDEDWGGRDAYFRPKEYGAFLSACMDGNNNKMDDGSGNNVFGIHSADPNLQIWIGGFAGNKMNYFTEMVIYMAEIRGESISSVVSKLYGIDFHYYSNDGGGQFGTRNLGTPPETEIYSRFSEVVEWRNRYYPSIKFHIGEFGYDSHWMLDGYHSRQAAPKIINGDAEQTKAAWLLRSLFEFAKAGVDEVKHYMLVNGGDLTAVYQSSGLTETIANGSGKLFSWYAFNTISKRLSNHKFVSWITNSDKRIVATYDAVNNEYGYICYTAVPYYERYDTEALAFADYTNVGDDVIILVIENITATRNGYYERTINQSPATFAEAFQLYTGREYISETIDINNQITEAKKVVITDGIDIGTESVLTVIGNTVNVDLSEMPILIISNVVEAILTANAGADKKITLPTNSVVINGSATDGTGTITDTIWTQISGPNTAGLSGDTTLTLTAINMIEGTYVFRLTVTDDIPLSDYDEMNVIVSPITNIVNSFGIRTFLNL